MIINNLEKTVDEKILTSFNHPETKKPCRRRQSWKNHFINNLMNKTANIFITHRKHADYELVLKLYHDGVIITCGDPFE